MEVEEIAKRSGVGGDRSHGSSKDENGKRTCDAQHRISPRSRSFGSTALLPWFSKAGRTHNYALGRGQVPKDFCDLWISSTLDQWCRASTIETLIAYHAVKVIRHNF
jgi:hypothetical protein